MVLVFDLAWFWTSDILDRVNWSDTTLLGASYSANNSSTRWEASSISRRRWMTPVLKPPVRTEQSWSKMTSNYRWTWIPLLTMKLLRSTLGFHLTKPTLDRRVHRAVSHFIPMNIQLHPSSNQEIQKVTNPRIRILCLPSQHSSNRIPFLIFYLRCDFRNPTDILQCTRKSTTGPTIPTWIESHTWNIFRWIQQQSKPWSWYDIRNRSSFESRPKFRFESRPKSRFESRPNSRFESRPKSGF